MRRFGGKSGDAGAGRKICGNGEIDGKESVWDDCGREDRGAVYVEEQERNAGEHYEFRRDGGLDQ